MRRRVRAALPLFVCMSTAALAEPTIYKGTLGALPIVAEFTDDIATAKGPVGGRYFYPAQGVDIPLNPVAARAGKAKLAEEKACTPKICKDPDGRQEPKPPTEAAWRLTAVSEGRALEGLWQRQGHPALPIRLERFAKRPAPNAAPSTAAELAEIVDDIRAELKPFDETASPYDFMKMQVPLDEGAETTWGDVAFRYVADPRTRFRFPRITRLREPVGSDHPANRYLQSAHWIMNLGALSCKAMQYRSFGWTTIYPGSDGPNLGGFDEQTIRVAYLSPTVMSWLEAGSTYCGGPHPDNFTSLRNLDVRRGAPLDLSRIFRGWVPRASGDDTIADPDKARADPGAYRWGPDDALTAFLLGKAEAKDRKRAGECEMKTAIGDYLQISFERGERAVFSLADLPHAMGDCEDVFFEAPLADLRGFLTPEAVEYFPSLKTR